VLSAPAGSSSQPTSLYGDEIAAPWADYEELARKYPVAPRTNGTGEPGGPGYDPNRPNPNVGLSVDPMIQGGNRFDLPAGAMGTPEAVEVANSLRTAYAAASPKERLKISAEALARLSELLASKQAVNQKKGTPVQFPQPTPGWPGYPQQGGYPPQQQPQPQPQPQPQYPPQPQGYQPGQAGFNPLPPWVTQPHQPPPQAPPAAAPVPVQFLGPDGTTLATSWFAHVVRHRGYLVLAAHEAAQPYVPPPSQAPVYVALPGGDVVAAYSADIAFPLAGMSVVVLVEARPAPPPPTPPSVPHPSGW
jgi:hypothetical protein